MVAKQSQKILLTLASNLSCYSLLRAVVGLYHRHRLGKDTPLHPHLNRFRRPLEDIAVLPHPSVQPRASRNKAVARQQLRQLANQDAAVARRQRVRKLHLRPLLLHQLLLPTEQHILLLQRTVQNPHRLSQNRLLEILLIVCNVLIFNIYRVSEMEKETKWKQQNQETPK